jgi:hypothetical protein
MGSAQEQVVAKRGYGAVCTAETVLRVDELRCSLRSEELKGRLEDVAAWLAQEEDEVEDEFERQIELNLSDILWRLDRDFGLGLDWVFTGESVSAVVESPQWSAFKGGAGPVGGLEPGVLFGRLLSAWREKIKAAGGPGGSTDMGDVLGRLSFFSEVLILMVAGLAARGDMVECYDGERGGYAEEEFHVDEVISISDVWALLILLSRLGCVAL